MQDRDLVAAIVAGDPAGLAATYDRYASALYAYCRTMLRDPEDAADALQDTFVVAAQKLDGLRDADRLRPWLYAVARNECLRRVRGRQAQATVQLEQAGEVSDDAVDVDAGLREADVRGLIWAAIQGLNPSEREVFELSVRHELEGADLAAALGVSPNHAHALLSRARGQLEKSLGALLVARTGREDCPELAAILTGWDGELTALLRKRINRHVEQCEICGERKNRELRPEALLGALPILLLPAGLRSRVLHLVGNALPGGGGGASGSGSAGSNGYGAARSNASLSDASSGEGSSGAATSAKHVSGEGASAAASGWASGDEASEVANAAAYCAHVAKLAEPFDRAGFPVALDRRLRPLAAVRRKSLVTALLLLLLLLGLGSYAALRFMAPDSAADALPTQSPSQVVVVLATSSAPIEISTAPASASPSRSPSSSPSTSPSPSPVRSTHAVVITSPSARASTSPAPSRSPSPSPPPPPGFLEMADPTSTPYVVWATADANGYQGTFTVTAQNGTVSGFTIDVPAPSQSWGYPAVDTPSHGPVASGDLVTVTVTLQTYPRNQPVVFVVQPPAPQNPIQITVSPSVQIIP